MLQVTQRANRGKPDLTEVPDPVARPGHVLICNHYSVISAGTEKYVVDLCGKSMVAKAKERPDHVRRVIDLVRTQGLWRTWSQVSEKLNEPISLGYSSAGVVLSCGAGVQSLKPGDRVASNGPHAGVVCVPKHLCARVPDEVALDKAAFGVIGSIALQGVRLAKLGLGDTVLVIGLGLVGQITVQLLKAQGCRVIGTDLDTTKCKLAEQLGADEASASITSPQVFEATNGIGADAVLITAATKSNAPVELAAHSVRQKGRVVVVGAVGLELPRQPFYLKEAELVVSCSYGAGRYDPQYEDRGHDYPAGHVRWTEQRNIGAVLNLMQQGSLDVGPLMTHEFDVEQANEAYEMISGGTQPYLGIVLRHPQEPVTARSPISLKNAKPIGGAIRVGCLGAGGFARMVLLPAIKECKSFQLRSLCSAGGLTAKTSGQRLGFQQVTADEDDVIYDNDVDVVFAMTRHDQHARQVLKSLQAGKHVFVEKPLAMNHEELAEIESVLFALGGEAPMLMVGFNRRFSPAAKEANEFFANVHTPMTVSIRFNAGPIPSDHWTQDDEVGGGRIVGEACHAIDLATFLTGSAPVRVFAESVGGPDASEITDDQCLITLRHANGSISNITYVSSGDKSFAKERVEIFGGGQVAVIDDFRELVMSSGGKTRKRRWNQDKGHRAEIAAFATALAKGGTAPIPWNELRDVSLASLLAVQSLREGWPLDL